MFEQESMWPDSMWNSLGIYVQDTGNGSPVVLLHSSGMSGEQWRKTSETLVSAGARVIVPDLTGSGRSPVLAEKKPFGFENDVEVVLRLLAKLAVPTDVVGHSYGGFVALQVALRAPASVRSLALYDPVAFGVLDADRDPEATADLARVQFGYGDSPEEHEAWLKTFVEYWGGRGAWSFQRPQMRDEFIRVGWVVHEGARSLVGDKTSASAYRALTMPVLLMTGETTPLAEARVVARLGEALPSVRLERIPGAGHMGPITHGMQVNALIAAHLSTLAP